jgi:cytochrome P450
LDLDASVTEAEVGVTEVGVGVTELEARGARTFGGGPRVCIGNQFALMEATRLLATIAQRFWMRMVPGHRVVPDPSITLRFKYGLKMSLTRRES